MEYINEIKADLPGCPHDVIVDWLIPFAESEGWPPGTDSHFNLCGRWKRLLRGQNLTYWKRLEWNKERLGITPIQLISTDFQMMKKIVFANVKNQINDYSLCMKEDGKKRFSSICSYLTETGSFPKPVILERMDSKYRLIDGCHRLAAYFYLYGYFRIDDNAIPCLEVSQEQEYWIAQ